MPHTLLMGWGNGAATLENSVTGPQMTKQSITGGPSNSTPRFLPKRNEHRYLRGNLFMNVYVVIIVNSINYNGQKVEAIQAFISGRIHKENVV